MEPSFVWHWTHISCTWTYLLESGNNLVYYSGNEKYVISYKAEFPKGKKTKTKAEQNKLSEKEEAASIKFLWKVFI